MRFARVAAPARDASDAVRCDTEIRAIQMLCSGNPDSASMRAARKHLAAAMMIHCLSCIETADPSPSASADAHGDMIVTEIKAFIDARIADTLPLDLIAETFGLSRRHATRLFRHRTGLSIAMHHERRRIERARELLSQTSLPIGEIAHRVGFESGSSLARVMRRVAGVAPGDVRRAARSDAS
jgi:AraC family transcriptional regulator